MMSPSVPLLIKWTKTCECCRVLVPMSKLLSISLSVPVHRGLLIDMSVSYKVFLKMSFVYSEG